jgi:SOS response associated peptidase (SRAP)
MIIDPAHWADWLDPANGDVADVRALLSPAAVTGLTTYPVSTEVNSVRNNGPHLIEPIGHGPVAPLVTVAATARAGAGDPGADGTGVLF